MKLFKRSLSLIIGSESEAITVTEPTTIRATIVKDLKTGEKDYAQITIFNLKHGTRDALNSKYQKISIIGGYADQTDTIFTGEVVSVSHKHEGTEWITVLECGDGVEILDTALINKTYEKGFKLGDILRDFASTNALPLEEIIGINENKALSRGKSFSTDMQSALNELGKAHDFDWSVQDGKLSVIKSGQGRAELTRVISARTGMVGSPEWINTGSDAAKLAVQKGLKFKVVSLCIPSLKPADLIIVESGSLQGRMGNYYYNVDKPTYRTEFIVSKVQHDLDNREGNFVTQIECTTLEETA